MQKQDYQIEVRVNEFGMAVGHVTHLGREVARTEGHNCTDRHGAQVEAEYIVERLQRADARAEKAAWEQQIAAGRAWRERNPWG